MTTGVIRFGTEVIRLANTDVTNLTAADFDFV